MKMHRVTSSVKDDNGDTIGTAYLTHGLTLTTLRNKAGVWSPPVANVLALFMMKGGEVYECEEAGEQQISIDEYREQLSRK